MLSFKKVWNEVISSGEERKLEPRKRIYASELGWSKVDTYLKMKATPPTNPANERSQRKFWAGNYDEEMVAFILKCAGIQFTRQDRALVEFPGCYPISGKVDFIAMKGKNPPDIPENAPEFVKKLALTLAEGVNCDEDTILEIKTCAGRVFEQIVEKKNAHLHHMFQAWTYRKQFQLPAVIVYMSRDDKLIEEFSIGHLDQELEYLVKKEVEQITYYCENDILPPKEALVLFEDGKFKKNLKVEYSSYLSMLYSRVDKGEVKPFENAQDYRRWGTSKAVSWNRVIKRVLDKLKMTDKNLDVLKEIEKFGYNLEKVYADFDHKKPDEVIEEETE